MLFVVSDVKVESAGVPPLSFLYPDNAFRSLIEEIPINSNFTAVALLWRPTPMGYAIKVAPSLYSIVPSWPSRVMNKTFVNIHQILPVKQK